MHLQTPMFKGSHSKVDLFNDNSLRCNTQIGLAKIKLWIMLFIFLDNLSFIHNFVKCAIWEPGERQNVPFKRTLKTCSLCVVLCCHVVFWGCFFKLTCLYFCTHLLSIYLRLSIKFRKNFLMCTFQLYNINPRS